MNYPNIFSKSLAFHTLQYAQLIEICDLQNCTNENRDTTLQCSVNKLLKKKKKKIDLNSIKLSNCLNLNIRKVEKDTVMDL